MMPPPAAPPRSALLIIFLVVVIDLLGFAIVLPLLPRIAKVYLAGQQDIMVGLTIGLLFSSFSAMQFLFAPLWGRLSDRIGRRPVMLIGLAGSVVFYAVFGYAATIPPEQSQLALFLMFASESARASPARPSRPRRRPSRIARPPSSANAAWHLIAPPSALDSPSARSSLTSRLMALPQQGTGRSATSRLDYRS